MDSKKAKTVVPATPIAVAKEMIEVATKAMPEGPGGDLLWYGCDNFNALMTSGTVLARGYHEILTLLVGQVRDQVSETMTLGRALQGAKTLKDVIDLTAEMLKLNMVTAISESIKLSELSSRVVEHATAPLQGRAAVVWQGTAKAA